LRNWDRRFYADRCYFLVYIRFERRNGLIIIEENRCKRKSLNIFSIDMWGQQWLCFCYRVPGVHGVILNAVRLVTV
jgi:hypothetical protein